ncbi:MAG: aldehyde dehydrogenase family protein [Actinobacteria bacterium]|nr:aldehyde dehydrogenase family protein [Actinomycetota bacterium]MDQ3531732.1 aldehyde dehydrogenase family protein [Actinomycetota bacterium]
MRTEYGNFINGEWVDSTTGGTFPSANPADRNEVVGTFARSGPKDVDQAVQAALRAYPDWMLTPVPQRADYLLRVALILEERKDEFAEVMTREMGKTLNESRADVQEGIDFAHYMSGEGRRFFGDTIPAELPNKVQMTMRHPVGVVGLITPWNFPIAIPLWKIAPALVAGCTAVFKPAEDTPLCAALLADVFNEVGLPPGVLNLVNGMGEGAGSALVDHPDVRAISFTGSLDVGRAINEKCARAMKRCSLELGSKNALIVMPDAQLELAVEASAWGAFATSGQRCTATSRLIVHEDVRETFTEQLLDRVGNMKVGNGLDPDVELAPVINEKQKNRVMEYISLGQQEGATLIAGGEELTGDEHANGYFVAPTVFDEMTPTMRIAREEIFGPVTGVMRVESIDEAIEAANGTEYGLSCSIYSHDITNIFKCAQRLEFGLVYANAPTIGAEIQVPFGGMKSTGNGHREAGPQALDEFTEWKTVAIDFSGKLQRAQMR